MSLARLGATMTELDFSPASLAEARRLAAISGTPVDFVESDVYGAPDVLEAGMTITGLVEHDTVPWDALPGHDDPAPGRRVAGQGPPTPASAHLHAAGGAHGRLEINGYGVSRGPLPHIV